MTIPLSNHRQQSVRELLTIDWRYEANVKTLAVDAVIDFRTFILKKLSMPLIKHYDAKIYSGVVVGSMHSLRRHNREVLL
jgi:hypothetical protein